MLSFLRNSEKKKTEICLICNESVTEMKTTPDICKDLFHYKCLRNYVDKRLDDRQPIICPESSCKKIFARIANKYKHSDEIRYQNVILLNDENTCCICFSKCKSPVASSDSCTHTFCFECINKWCTFKHECPMDRKPIKMLLISDFPGGHITDKLNPPPIEQDLNGDGDNDEIGDTTCEICNSGQDEHQLLLCDNCNRGYHIYCLSEPLQTIPEGDWFCEVCRSHRILLEDTSAVAGRRLPRGLGRVITNLQERLESSNTITNRQRISNSLISRTRSRPVRQLHDNESSGEWYPRHIAGESTQIERRGNFGLRTRISSVTVQTSTNSTRRGVHQLRHLDTSLNDNESNESASFVADTDSVNEHNDLTLSESEEQLNPQSGTRKTTNRRNNDVRAQGSVSSDLQSEMESRKKRIKLSGDSSLHESSYDTSESSLENEIDPIRIRSTVSATQKLAPRKIKEESSDDDDERPSIISLNRKRRLLIESESDNEESKWLTLSVSSRINKVLKTHKCLSRTDDTYLQPSTSQKKTFPKKKLAKKRKNKKSKNVKRRPIKAKVVKKVKIPRNIKKSTGAKLVIKGLGTKTSKKLSENANLSSKLSIVGRENQLPWFSSDEKDTKVKSSPIVSSVHRSSSSSGSILSEINERQNNLRNMSLSTIERLTDGTVIYKPKTPERPVVSSIVSTMTPQPSKQLFITPDKGVTNDFKNSDPDSQCQKPPHDTKSRKIIQNSVQCTQSTKTYQNDAQGCQSIKHSQNTDTSNQFDKPSPNIKQDTLSRILDQDTQSIKQTENLQKNTLSQKTSANFEVVPKVNTLIKTHSKTDSSQYISIADPVVSIPRKPSVHFSIPLPAPTFKISPSLLDVPSTSQTSCEPGPSLSNSKMDYAMIERYVTRSLLKIKLKIKLNIEEFQSIKERIIDKVLKNSKNRPKKDNVIDYVKKYMKYWQVKKNR